MTASSPTPRHPNSKQSRMREKAEEINLVLLEPDVDLWKLRELALTDGGLVNDTLRRRAWPKLVGLTSNFHNDEFDAKMNSMASPSRKVRKTVAAHRVINFGDDDINPGTAFTGGPFDQHDTAATTALAEDDNTTLGSFEDSVLSSHVVACMDAEQIERDVTRCTWHLLTGGQRSRRRVMVNKHRKKISRILRQKQRRLGDLINLTLALSEVDLPIDQRLCYYQGYHDVASIFLAALGGASSKAIEKHQQQLTASPGSDSEAAIQAASLGLEMSSKVLYQVSLSHFREPMRSNFHHLQTTLRMVLFPLLHAMDPEVHAHLYGCGMEPFFALPWMLTWFAHDIRDTTVVKRLFDFFLCSHPLMPIYLSVAMLCNPSNRQEVLATPCEFAELHSVLAGLPKNSSMVGWKYRVGDGYVSDDEQVGEDGETSISLDSDMASHLSGQNSTNRGHSLLSGIDTADMMRREDLILSEDHAHIVTMGIPAHVPFQELIDSAISFMGRVPPRKLLALAMRYFDPLQAEPIVEMYPSITLFHSPPWWSLAGTAKADWVLKQRAREQFSTKATPKDRGALVELRRRHVPSIHRQGEPTDTKTSTAKDGDDNTIICTPETVEQAAKKLKWPKAMVALGFGPGEDEVVRQRKRRKLLLIGGAATVAVFAIVVGITLSYRAQGTTPTKFEQPASTSELLNRKDALPYVTSPTAGAMRGKPAKGSPSAAPAIENSPPKESCEANVKEDSESLTEASMSMPPSDATTPLAVYTTSNETLLQRILVKRLQLIYAKVRLLVRTVELLLANVADPALPSNVQRILNSSLSKLAQTISNPEGLTIVQTNAVRASQNLGRFGAKTLKSALVWAIKHLGGDNLEELELGV